MPRGPVASRYGTFVGPKMVLALRDGSAQVVRLLDTSFHQRNMPIMATFGVPGMGKTEFLKQLFDLNDFRSAPRGARPRPICCKFIAEAGDAATHCVVCVVVPSVLQTRRHGRGRGFVSPMY